MRCYSCEKFVSLEFAEPEIDNDLQIEGTVVSCIVRIHRDCADCGTEMKEAAFDLEADVVGDELCPDHIKEDGTPIEGHELSVEEGDVEQIEESGGRYQKSYFGVSVSYSVYCSCQPEGSEPLVSGSMEDKIAASAMDEC